MRGPLAGFVAVIGILLLPLADAGVWTRQQLLPRGELVELATDVLDEDEVRVALAERITEEIDAQAGLSRRARSIVEPAVEAGLTTAPFQEVYRRAAGAVHDQLMRGDDRLVLRFDGVLPLVRRAVEDIDPEIAEEIPPEGLPDITIVTDHEAPLFFRAVELVRRASLVFPIVCVVLLLAAVALATRHRVALGWVGGAVMVVALALVVLVKFFRGLLSTVTGPELDVAAFEAGYDVVTRDFVLQTLVLALIGAVVMLGGIALHLRRVRNTRPRSWA